MLLANQISLEFLLFFDRLSIGFYQSKDRGRFTFGLCKYTGSEPLNYLLYSHSDHPFIKALCKVTREGGLLLG